MIHPIDRGRWLATFSDMLSAVLRERRREVIDIARVDHLIDEFDKCDAQGQEADFGLVDREAAEHGRQREKLGIDVSHVVNDYVLVCDAVAELGLQRGRAGVRRANVMPQRLEQHGQSFHGVDVVIHHQAAPRLTFEPVASTVVEAALDAPLAAGSRTERRRWVVTLGR